MTNQNNHTNNNSDDNCRSFFKNGYCIIDRIKAMMTQETTLYSYGKVEPRRNELIFEEDIRENSWREKICDWNYSLVDHFGLARETVAVSMNLFDRFLATRGNLCDRRFALLASLCCLNITIKVHETQEVTLETLIELGKGEFSVQDMEGMEMDILQSLNWLVNPPTALDFTAHLLKLLPPSLSHRLKHDIFQVARYAIELSVFDTFFIAQNPSKVAFATLLNVISDLSYEVFPLGYRERYFSDLNKFFELKRGCEEVRAVRTRLRQVAQDVGFPDDVFEQEETPIQLGSPRRAEDFDNACISKDKYVYNSNEQSLIFNNQ